MTELRQRQPRRLDRKYLDWLKTRYCIACSQMPPCDPAHIRSASPEYGKPLTGAGRKPDDKWAVPLCRHCHDEQHAAGNELEWWKGIGRDPFRTAMDYYAQFGGKGGHPKKQRTKSRTRPPKDKRQKIPQRKTQWPKRPFRSTTRTSSGSAS